jgi:protein gp37
MADLFLDQVPFGWVDAVVAAMAMTPWVTHQVLTKRSRRMLNYFRGDYPARVLAVLDRWDCEAHGGDPTPRSEQMRTRLGNRFRAHLSWPLPWAWFGVSVGVQKSVYRVEHLRETPVALRSSRPSRCWRTSRSPASTGSTG